MKSIYKVITEKEDISVAPTPTVLFLSQTGPSEVITIEIENRDGTQILACTIDTSWDGSTNWVTKNALDLDGIGPGDVRQVSIDISNFRWVRVVGTANGAGLTARTSAELSYQTSGHIGGR